MYNVERWPNMLLKLCGVYISSLHYCSVSLLCIKGSKNALRNYTLAFSNHKHYGNQINHYLTNLSVMRQKGESQNRCFKKAKHAKISEK